MVSPKYIGTGSRAVLTIANIAVAYTQSVEVFGGISYEPIKECGRIGTTTHAPVDYNVSLRFSRVFVIGESLQKLQLTPHYGVSDSEFQANILNTEDMTAVISDVVGPVLGGVTDATGRILLVEGVRVGPTSKGFEPGRVVMESIDCVALRILELIPGGKFA